MKNQINLSLFTNNEKNYQTKVFKVITVQENRSRPAEIITGHHYHTPTTFVDNPEIDKTQRVFHKLDIVFQIVKSTSVETMIQKPTLVE